MDGPTAFPRAHLVTEWYRQEAELVFWEDGTGPHKYAKLVCGQRPHAQNSGGMRERSKRAVLKTTVQPAFAVLSMRYGTGSNRLFPIVAHGSTTFMQQRPPQYATVRLCAQWQCYPADFVRKKLLQVRNL